MRLKGLYLILSIVILSSCQKTENQESTKSAQEDTNPAEEGFNEVESDSKAISIADSVMEAMGGRKAWDDLRYIKWNFFGVRDLTWDKETGLVRIESPRDSSTYLVNVKTDTGRVKLKNVEITQPDSVNKYVSRGKSIWINDSYWLVMPFKLKDTGVTLKYVREDTTMKGNEAHVLQLTFDNVGDTPQNKYEVFVDKSDYLVKQWSYFQSAEQDSASAIWPWDNYKDYNGLLLSGDRSDNKGPKNISVYDSLPDRVFTKF